MIRGRRILFLELNEVPYRIIDDFCARHPDSALAHMLPRAAQYVTHTDDTPLSPWITWPTLHRGIDSRKHGILQLGQDTTEIDSQWPPIWKTLEGFGARVGVFGSLHSYPAPSSESDYAFYVPDTFAGESRCIPSHIDAFQELNLYLARLSARNVTAQIPWRASLKVLSMAPRLGLRATTLLSVARQLVNERLRTIRRVRRRTYQAALGFDIFMKLVEDKNPEFATFFTNHVASTMHRYWAAAYPWDYDVNGYSPTWQATFRDEIDFTMRQADTVLARVVRFVEADPRYTLWVASSMGQAPTSAEPVETQLYIADLDHFMEAMGVAHPGDWHQRAAMLPQTVVYVAPRVADTFRESLQHLVIDGQPLGFNERADGFFSLDLGHWNLHDKPRVALLDSIEVPFTRLGLACVTIEDAANSNAYHVPEGSLMVYDPTAPSISQERVQVPLTDVHRMILDMVQP